MKKLFFALAMLLGVTACENSEQEPTLPQIIENFEMTTELGADLTKNLADHMLISQKMYYDTWEESYPLGGGPTSYFFQGDGNVTVFQSGLGPGNWISSLGRHNAEWSYDNTTNSIIIEGESHPIVYYKHPVLIWKQWVGYSEFVLEDTALLEEYTQKYHHSLPISTVNNEWLSGRVYAFTAHIRTPIPIHDNDEDFMIENSVSELQYIYFAEDGTGIAFVQAPAKGDKKISKYQLPIKWTVEDAIIYTGNKKHVIRLNDAMYVIVRVFEKYISAQKEIIGLELHEAIQKAPDILVGDCDDYDLDQLKAEYTDPQP